NISLRAVIDGDDLEFGTGLPAVALAELPAGFIPLVKLRAADILREVHAFEARPFRRLFMQRLEIELALGVVNDDPVWRAAVADRARERAGIDAGDPRHVVLLQPFIEMLVRAPVRGAGDILADDQPARDRVDRLDILGIRADIAYVREGEG